MRVLFSVFLFLTVVFGAGAWEVQERRQLSAPEGLAFSLVRVGENGRTAELHIVVPSTKFRLAVLDNPAGDLSVREAAQRSGAAAAVNGGYFHPDRKPLGLVVSDGKRLHEMQRAKLLSGFVAVTPKGASLLRVAEFKPAAPLTQALQAGPFLVDRGKPVAGLNATRTAARTVVLAGNAGQIALAVCRYLTLAETGAVLAVPELISGFRVQRALNLDGGSSTGLFVAGKPPFHYAEMKGVRNFLAIVPR